MKKLSRWLVSQARGKICSGDVDWLRVQRASLDRSRVFRAWKNGNKKGKNRCENSIKRTNQPTNQTHPSQTTHTHNTQQRTTPATKQPIRSVCQNPEHILNTSTHTLAQIERQLAPIASPHRCNLPTRKSYN
jgi:hypothetical protein